ncbi:hypothetical protein [Nocardioides daeguensis]|uniref:AbiEi antitoxin C-terminal domain-containing protein n=1 Tax=Nocardioides daeguensis TaxID=908359 RepID=A0ABP6W218_9ACTN|nr:hypothetical protein [Nocardioides daeguensis]MBV6726612.1 hypothetical protein [Nocardioides daeguensis]MCR1774636.1 hypothetical protein [Nocardioides daeguensis]
MEIGSDGAIRGEVRAAGHQRVSHGLYRLETTDLGPWDNFIRDLSALLLVLPSDAVFTHVTGGRLLGWRLPSLPAQVPHFAAVRGQRRPRRPGLICSRLTHQSSPRLVHGLPVDEPAEILLRAARDLGDIDLAIMLDSAVRHGHVDDAAIQRVLASKRPGTRRLRRVWEGRDAQAESAGETLLRKFHDTMDIATASQVDIYDGGRWICRADLVVLGTRNLHEYDGAIHREPSVHRRDLRRERAIASTEYVRRGYTLDDLLNHAATLMHELDRLLGRPHQAERLRRWRALIDDSFYSAVGRDRVMNRWYRSTNPVGWARTA